MPTRPPLVFVPGFPASSLEIRSDHSKVFPPALGDLLVAAKKKRILAALAGPDVAGDDDGVDVRSPIRYSIEVPILDIGKEAQSLYDLLEDRFGYDTHHGTDFRGVGWDWRRPVDLPQTLDRVQAAIDELHQLHARQVVLLVHSTGGLVARALIEQRPAVAAKISSILALGVPWAGVVKAFRYLAFGEPVGLGPIKLLSAKESRNMMRRSHAAFDLLPPDPTRTAMTDTIGRPLNLATANGVAASPLVEKRWLGEDLAAIARADSSDQRLGGRSSRIAWATANPVPIVNLAGWGAETDTRAELLEKEDGNTPWVERTIEGDGTVPRASADWLRGPEVTTLYLPIGVYGDQLATQKHSQLWRTPPAGAVLETILGSGASEPHAWASVDADDAIDRRRRVRVRMVLADDQGHLRSQGEARVLVGGQEIPIPLAANLRGELDFPRGTLTPNIAGSRLHRFVVRFSWRGLAQPIERALLIEV
jgi:pimeloyl-ACP methyl ester carboxylesterase